MRRNPVGSMVNINDVEKPMTVADWGDLVALCEDEMRRAAASDEESAHLVASRLRAKCEIRRMALKEGRVMP
jgi:hypothetical protein